ncbi:MAG: hypothetical protein ACK5LO_05190 [Leucobacter sp.]
MIEIFLAAWLATAVSSAQVEVTAVTSKQALCEARAGGVADALGASTHGEFWALEQAGIDVNPRRLDGPGCKVAVAENIHAAGAVDGVEKVGFVGPERLSVVWKVNP